MEPLQKKERKEKESLGITFRFEGENKNQEERREREKNNIASEINVYLDLEIYRHSNIEYYSARDSKLIFLPASRKLPFIIAEIFS